jgi:hypothetical protein
VWKRLSQTKGCSSEQERNEHLELLLPTEYVERHRKEMKKRCLGLQDSLALIPIVNNGTLTLIERMTLQVGAIF